MIRLLVQSNIQEITDFECNFLSYLEIDGGYTCSFFNSVRLSARKLLPHCSPSALVSAKEQMQKNLNLSLGKQF